MILAAQPAQGQIKLRGQHQDEQPLDEGHLAPQQAKADEHRDQGDAQGRKELQRQRRQEGHPQHPHGGLAVVVGQPGDHLGFAAAGIEQLQDGQVLHHLEEMGAQPGQARPLPLVQPLGAPADQDHEQGDQRRGAGQHQPRQPIQRRHGGQDGRRHQRRRHHGRQEAGVIGVQRLDPIGQQGGQVAGALAGQRDRPQGRQMGDQAGARLLLDPGGGLGGQGLAAPGQQPAQGDQRQQRPQAGPGLGQAEPGQHHLGHHPGQQPGLQDQQPPARKAAEGRSQDRPPNGGPAQAQQGLGRAKAGVVSRRGHAPPRTTAR